VIRRLHIFKVGGYKHGLDFAFGINHKTGEVSPLRNYLMKYLAKTFVETIPNWTPEEFVLNAIVWKEGYRFFGCSRDLSNAMKKPKKENHAFIWFSIIMSWSYDLEKEDILLQESPTWKIPN